MSEKQKRWMSSGCLKAAPTGRIDNEQGIIEGVSVCTVGEAEGHGVSLDSEFIQRVAELGGSRKQGLKARFGHPNMCSTALGTFIGRFKNFRVEKEQAKADLFLSNEAKETPHGNLYDYVMGMATNEPDMFGTSIVFTPGRIYKRNEKGEKVYEPGWSVGPDETGVEHDARRQEYRDCPGPEYVECEELHACDAVDEPAANDGLFSRFAQETVAGQITEFLDLHPQVWEVIESNPSIVEALARYGDKMDEFITRYRAHRGQNGKGSTMPDERTSSEQLEEASVAEPQATETPEVEIKVAEDEVEAAEAVPAESEVVEEVTPSAEVAEATEPEEVKQEAEPLSREEFTRIADEFGAEIAVQTVRDGGNYQSALKAAHDAQKVEIEKLKKALAVSGNGTPVAVVEVPKKEKGKLFNTGK